VDRSKVPSGKLALHDIIDQGERLVGFEHPAGFCFQMGDGVPHLVGQLRYLRSSSQQTAIQEESSMTSRNLRLGHNFCFSIALLLLSCGIA
jgi:hypothetical protein